MSASDIDIAHRVQLRNATTDNGHRRQPNAIICKFTRRMSWEKLLASRRNTTQLTTEALGLPPTVEVNRIKIYSHLDCKLMRLGQIQKHFFVISIAFITENLINSIRHVRRLAISLITFPQRRFLP